MNPVTPRTTPNARKREREWTHQNDPPGFHLQQTIKTVAKARALLQTELAPRERRQVEDLLKHAEASRNRMLKQLAK